MCKDLHSAIACNIFLQFLMGKKVIKKHWESQLLPCRPEVVTEMLDTEIKVNGNNVGLCPRSIAYEASVPRCIL